VASSKYLCQDFSEINRLCVDPVELASVNKVRLQKLKEQFNNALDITQIERGMLPSLSSEYDVSELSVKQFIVQVFSEMKNSGMIPSIMAHSESKELSGFLRIANSARPIDLLPLNNLTQEELIVLGVSGHKMAQKRVLDGYSYGYYGFKKSEKELQKLLKKGWGGAFPYTAEDLRATWVDTPDDQLMGLAEPGSKGAQFFIAENYALGIRGFQQSPEDLMKLVHKHWEGADWFVVWGLIEGKYGFSKSSERILELAEEGLPCFQRYAVSGYATGHYGFEQSTEKLFELADKEWKTAKEIIAKGYAENRYGLQVSPDALINLADAGVVEAQKLLVKGLEKQMSGFPENPILYGLFKAYYNLNDDL
jgi:hypothetical protein